MKSSISIIISILLTFLSLIAIAKAEVKDKVKIELKHNFSQLSYVKTAKHFPASRKSWNICVERDNKQCIRSYEKFKESKSVLEKKTNLETLKLTLDIMKESCSKYLLEGRADVNLYMECQGSLMSLYFFENNNHDEIILNYFKILPSEVVTFIFKNEYYWFLNRPYKTDWIDYIKSPKITWEDEAYKNWVLKIFKESYVWDEDPWIAR